VAEVDAAPVVEGEVMSATVFGIHVLVQHIPGAAFAAGQLYVRGGSRNWTAGNAGIEEIAFRVMATGGTTALDKGALSRRLAALGASLSGDAHIDFSGLYMKAPVSAWDDAFALMVDAFLNPALPPEDIEVARTQILAELHHEQESPEGQVWASLRTQLFAGHPYANRPNGTVESVSGLRADDIGPYLRNLREASRLVFVAAGDLDGAHVVDQVRNAFSALPRGAYVDAPLSPIAFGAPHVATLERKLPASYSESVFPAPRWGDPDFVVGLVAMGGLSSRLEEQVRAKPTCTVEAYVNDNVAIPLGVLGVTAATPNVAIKVVLDEVRRLQAQPMGAEELAGIKSMVVTGYVERHETPDGQAASLADALLFGGDWHLARTFLDRARSVTAADVQLFATKYMVHLQTAVVGDPSKVDQALFTSL
jgi:predicted Zn-dependent peptidase